MNTRQERERILQTKSVKELQHRIDALDMVTVYMLEEPHDKRASRDISCALIPSNQIEQALSDIDWDLDCGLGWPSTVTYYRNGMKHVKYLRFGNSKGIEPLIVGNEEIAEEFRLFHRLHHNQKRNRYIKIDEEGEKHVVAVIEPNQIKIRAKEIRQFLAIKEMHLSIQFCYLEHSPYTLEELELTEGTNDHRDNLCCWNFHCTDRRSIGEQGTCSRVLGKRLIEPLPKSKSEFLGFSEPKKSYVDFIIGSDNNGHEIIHTCNPDDLAGSFGANPDAPNYLASVSFRKDVLNRYYDRPEKYKVSDGFLRCRAIWGIPIDNHHDNKVCVWLGDLGRLPYSEQKHWRAHNILSSTGISATFLHRQILARPATSRRPEHIFQVRYDELQRACESHLGWQLLLPLDAGDQYHLQNIRVPSHDEQPDFDGLVLGLTKILIDSLNEKKLNMLITDESIQTLKGGSLSRLEAVLNNRDASNASDHVGFLRKLQKLRSSGSSHRKGDKYKTAISHFETEDGELSSIFENILRQAVALLDYLINFVKQNRFHETR